MTTTLRIPAPGRLWAALAAFALALAAPVAWAQGAKNAVESIDFSSVQGGKIVVKIGSRTRLVMNLTRNLTYTQSLDGKQLVVTLEGSGLGASGAPTANAPS